MASDLPVDRDGACMRCKAKPPEAENVLCCTCATPWHVPYLTKPPETLATWLCPDCSDNFAVGGKVAAAGGSGDLVVKIRAIEEDATLGEKEKARMAQEKDEEEQDKGSKKKGGDGDVMDLLDESFKCSICMQLPERPVTETNGWIWVTPPPENTSVREQLLKDFSCQICHQVMALPLSTPCGHNFCEPCLLGFYADQSSVRERVTADGLTLRARKIVKKCPACSTDIADYLENAQVNRQVKDIIERLQREAEENELAGKEEDGEEDLVEDEAGSDDEDEAEEDSDWHVPVAGAESINPMHALDFSFLTRKCRHMSSSDPAQEDEPIDDLDAPPFEPEASSSVPLASLALYRTSISKVDFDHICAAIRYQTEMLCALVEAQNISFPAQTAQCHPLPYSGPPFSPWVSQHVHGLPSDDGDDGGDGDAYGGDE